MTLVEFDSMPVSAATQAPKPVQRQTLSVEATEQVRVIASQAAGYLGKPVPEWNWSDLRDFIITQVESRHGAQVRDPKKEAGIIKSFIGRWGIVKAVAIATAAFDVHGGMWRSSPITITRFTKNSDPYFAEVIAKNLA